MRPFSADDARCVRLWARVIETLVLAFSVDAGLIGKVEFSGSAPTEELIPMTDDRSPFAEQMAKAGDGDFPPSVAESVLQLIMEADVDGVIGADRPERSGDRPTGRNGYRERSLDRRLGTPNLKIPELRTGAYSDARYLKARAQIRRAVPLMAKMHQLPAKRSPSLSSFGRRSESAVPSRDGVRHERNRHRR